MRDMSTVPECGVWLELPRADPLEPSCDKFKRSISKEVSSDEEEMAELPYAEETPDVRANTVTTTLRESQSRQSTAIRVSLTCIDVHTRLQLRYHPRRRVEVFRFVATNDQIAVSIGTSSCPQPRSTVPYRSLRPQSCGLKC
jgi:hypothetical protein